MIFILIITTNLIDKSNFTRVKDSVVAIYEDRLIANNLIFEISNSIRQMMHNVFVYSLLRVSTPKLVNNYRPRKSARIFVSMPKAINKL
jgi:hypothetical protein